jgi:hypothetical protein
LGCDEPAQISARRDSEAADAKGENPNDTEWVKDGFVEASVVFPHFKNH